MADKVYVASGVNYTAQSEPITGTLTVKLKAADAAAAWTAADALFVAIFGAGVLRFSLTILKEYNAATDAGVVENP